MRRNLLLTVAGAAVGAAVLTGAFVAMRNTPPDEAPSGTTMAPLTELPTTDQAFYIQSVSGPGGHVLSVSVGGKIASFPNGVSAGERELFVLSQIKGDKFQIKTAYARVNGAPSCLTARGGRVFTNPCDPAEWAQTVQLTPAGSPTFDLVVGGSSIELGADGTVGASERGGQAASTRFGFIDGGPAPKI
jgi:hypothetical protein